MGKSPLVPPVAIELCQGNVDCKDGLSRSQAHGGHSLVTIIVGLRVVLEAKHGPGYRKQETQLSDVRVCWGQLVMGPQRVGPHQAETHVSAPHLPVISCHSRARTLTLTRARSLSHTHTRSGS